jgi:hypothetical protein
VEGIQAVLVVAAPAPEVWVVEVVEVWVVEVAGPERVVG